MDRRPPLTPGLLLGLIVLALGVVLFLDRQGVVDASRIFPFFWPGAMVAVGLFKLALSRTGSGRAWGVLLAGAGVVFILGRLGYVRASFPALWPLILIAAGVVFIWRALEEGGGRPSARPDGRDRVLNELAVFGGGELQSDASDFRGGEVFALFGGYKIDLRKASMQADQAVIHASALFGGIDIRVPLSWAVVLDGVPVLGGFTDDTHHPAPGEGGGVKRLVVKGFAMFGGVAVKN
jgi:predicted membrane protein